MIGRAIIITLLAVFALALLVGESEPPIPPPPDPAPAFYEFDPAKVGHVTGHAEPERR